MRERQPDLKILNSEEDYHKILIFFANCMSLSFAVTLKIIQFITE